MSEQSPQPNASHDIESILPDVSEPAGEEAQPVVVNEDELAPSSVVPIVKMSRGMRKQSRDEAKANAAHSGNLYRLRMTYGESIGTTRYEEAVSWTSPVKRLAEKRANKRAQKFRSLTEKAAEHRIPAAPESKRRGAATETTPTLSEEDREPLESLKSKLPFPTPREPVVVVNPDLINTKKGKKGHDEAPDPHRRENRNNLENKPDIPSWIIKALKEAREMGLIADDGAPMLVSALVSNDKIEKARSLAELGMAEDDELPEEEKKKALYRSRVAVARRYLEYSTGEQLDDEDQHVKALAQALVAARTLHSMNVDISDLSKIG